MGGTRTFPKEMSLSEAAAVENRSRGLTHIHACTMNVPTNAAEGPNAMVGGSLPWQPGPSRTPRASCSGKHNVWIPSLPGPGQAGIRGGREGPE